MSVFVLLSIDMLVFVRLDGIFDGWVFMWGLVASLFLVFVFEVCLCLVRVSGVVFDCGGGVECWGRDNFIVGLGRVVWDSGLPGLSCRACAVLSTEDGLDGALPVRCIFRGSFGLVPGERTLERVFRVFG